VGHNNRWYHNDCRKNHIGHAKSAQCENPFRRASLTFTPLPIDTVQISWSTRESENNWHSLLLKPVHKYNILDHCDEDSRSEPKNTDELNCCHILIHDAPLYSPDKLMH
jgi:hypothetical protein